MHARHPKNRILTTWFHCVLLLPVVHMCLHLSQVGLPGPFLAEFASFPKVDAEVWIEIEVECSGTSGMAWQLEKIKQTIITQNNTILLQWKRTEAWHCNWHPWIFFSFKCNFIYRTNTYTTYNTNIILTFTLHCSYLHYLYKQTGQALTLLTILTLYLH